MYMLSLVRAYGTREVQPYKDSPPQVPHLEPQGDFSDVGVALSDQTFPKERGAGGNSLGN